MKIKKSIITKDNSKVYSIFGFKTMPVSSFKFTRNETKLAMRSAMRLRKRASKKWNCSFNEISMAHCLKEAYRRIAEEKLTGFGILTKENKQIVKKFVEKEFKFNNIDTLIRKTRLKIEPKTPIQNILLNFAKLEMKTRMMEG